MSLCCFSSSTAAAAAARRFLLPHLFLGRRRHRHRHDQVRYTILHHPPLAVAAAPGFPLRGRPPRLEPEDEPHRRHRRGRGHDAPRGRLPRRAAPARARVPRRFGWDEACRCRLRCWAPRPHPRRCAPKLEIYAVGVDAETVLVLGACC
uniref:cDNA clone:J013086D06, full insert sequence n=1 Tax=Oryza sativa subsp. japonica TaxID=39947 RepID=B7EK63_ORYSJ|nr:unnamed protein product [Oryza sativa Japonica Group]